MTRPRAWLLLTLLGLGACYGELGRGDEAYERGAIDPQVEPVEPGAEPRAEPAPPAPPAPAQTPAAPAPAPEPEAPSAPPRPASGALTVGGIVGGAYTVTQGYGPAAHDYGYAYCHSLGDWPAGQIVHCGLDVGLARGHALFAPGDGVVTIAGGTGYYADAASSAAGQLTIALDDGAQVILGHCSAILVAKGQRVTRGQRVALSGGSCAGGCSHLHLEVRVSSGARTVDPLAFFGP